MLNLVIGLVIFFGLHSINIFAPQWRARSMASTGTMRWKMRFGLITLLAVASIIMGFMQAHQAPIWIWHPPYWTRHVSALFMLFAFYCAACAVIPGTKVKSLVGHPFLIAIKVWAFAHLLSNGSLADIILFGSFLVWSIAAYAVMRRRDREAGVAKPEHFGMHMDLAAFAATMICWFAMVFFLHKLLFGVSPLV